MSDLKSFGVSEEELAAIREAQSEETDENDLFAVWPENRATLQLFLDVSAHWRRSRISAGERLFDIVDGLDYSAVEAVMNIKGIPAEERTELFYGLKEMEAAAAMALNERNNRS